jgi:prohibitin 2
MLTIFISLALALIGIGVFFGLRAESRRFARAGLLGPVLALILLAFSSYTEIRPSHTGVVTTMGAIGSETLAEGPHFISPLSKVYRVYGGLDVASAADAQAGSKDLQSVHSTLTVNFYTAPGHARQLFALNTPLNYESAFVVPATYEVFKAVVSHYTAEELVIKRQEVSAAITAALNTKLEPYHLKVQSVNLVNFGFSKAFDAAIEEKVTASQKAATAERNLEKAKFEAQARVTQAEGEAKAIAIQAAAVEKQGGVGYVQLQAIAKWDGHLPATMAGGAVPFLNIK